MGGPELEIPSEGERRVSFIDACRRFQAAVDLRLAQMREPGKRPSEEVKELDTLRAWVMLMMLRTQGRDVSRLKAELEGKRRADATELSITSEQHSEVRPAN
jgi:hypothetical protein